MDKLPNEIITYIFQHLPQNYYTILSSVCRRWKYILTQPLLFYTLDIYSTQQLKKYIEKGKFKLKNNDLPIGHSVKHLYFHTRQSICPGELAAISTTFPNLRSIQGIFTICKKSKYRLINNLHQLENILYWYQNYSPDWYSIIFNHPLQIKSFELTLSYAFLSEHIYSPYTPIQSRIALITPVSLNKTIYLKNNDTNEPHYSKDRIAINLPMLSSLTRLSIDGDGVLHDMGIYSDEHMFESIHQSCPQLISLTLKAFRMKIANNYDNYRLLLQPNLQLKELNIGHQFYDSKCYDYLSIKYFHLESFSFTFYQRFYDSHLVPSYKLSIYNMVTQYKYLKKLSTTFDTGHNQIKIWPHDEILLWLKQNPSHLSHLEFNYGFFKTVFIKREDKLNTEFIPSSSLSTQAFFYDDDFYRSLDYLNHLSSLSIGSDPSLSVGAFYYYYLCNINSNVVSNSIEVLNITTSTFLNIYFWLNIFSNLKSLCIIGKSTSNLGPNEITAANGYDYFNGFTNNCNPFKEKCQFIKERMDQKKQQSTTNSTIMTGYNNNNNNNNNKHYKLKRIEMKDCIINFKKYGWNGFFNHFNDLRTIILFNINSIRKSNNNTSIKKVAQQSTFDLSHLSLDFLSITNFNYISSEISTIKQCYVRELMIKDTSSIKPPYYIGFENEYKSSLFHYEDSAILNIKYIFQYVPRRYIPTLSIVCRKWYNILTQPLFLNTLDIYSIRQLKKYIEMGNGKSKMNDLPFGHSVKHLYFYTDHHVCLREVKALIDSFPNLHSIQGSFTIVCKPRYYTKRLLQIKHVSNWYQSENNHWMDIISSSPHQIKSLEFIIKHNLFALNMKEQEQQQLSSSSSSSSSHSSSTSESSSSSLLLSTSSSISSFSCESSLSSPSPIIYITPITPYKLRSPDFDFSDLTRYRIYTIKIPVLPSLTHLTIDFERYDGDERMFESIHQSCPRLISLNLKSLNMHISDDYDKNKSSLQPSLLVKELNIGNHIYDPKCFDYLSMKYPHLESLHIILYRRVYTKTAYPSFRLAIYNMITQYKYLKRLAVNSVSKIFSGKVWPHAELLHWLKQNPKQFSHLDYDYIFIEPHLTYRESPSRITSSSLSAFNNDIFYQSHDYLYHLTSLTIGSEPTISIYALYYFYLCNKDSSILSNSIEELKIDSIRFGNIFFWLEAFPNLKSFIIHGAGEVTNINDDDIGDDRFYKEKYQFLKKRMGWKQQNDTDSTTTTTTNNHPQRYYKLKKIELKHCVVDFKKYGWNGFFKHFNDLKAITLIQVNQLHTSFNTEHIIEPAQQATLDLSHLSLNLIKIGNFNYDQYALQTHKDHYVKELMIKETLLNKTYYIGFENEYSESTFHYENSTTLNIICKYIDNISFDQNSPIHDCRQIQ
ncbi:unnamed protein product [Cunninghamella blakesleeana]